MNKNILNRKTGIVDLSPLKDAMGQRLILRPMGQEGDRREITEETANHESVKNFAKHGWVELSDVSLEPTETTEPSGDSKEVEVPMENNGNKVLNDAANTSHTEPAVEGEKQPTHPSADESAPSTTSEPAYVEPKPEVVPSQVPATETHEEPKSEEQPLKGGKKGRNS